MHGHTETLGDSTVGISIAGITLGTATAGIMVVGTIHGTPTVGIMVAGMIHGTPTAGIMVAGMIHGTTTDGITADGMTLGITVVRGDFMTLGIMEDTMVVGIHGTDITTIITDTCTVLLTSITSR